MADYFSRHKRNTWTTNVGKNTILETRIDKFYQLAKKTDKYYHVVIISVIKLYGFVNLAGFQSRDPFKLTQSHIWLTTRRAHTRIFFAVEDCLSRRCFAPKTIMPCCGCWNNFSENCMPASRVRHVNNLLRYSSCAKCRANRFQMLDTKYVINRNESKARVIRTKMDATDWWWPKCWLPKDHIINSLSVAKI